MKCTAYPQDKCSISGNHMNLEQALNQTEILASDISSAVIYSAVNKSNNGYTYIPTPQGLLTSDDNSLFALTN